MNAIIDDDRLFKSTYYKENNYNNYFGKMQRWQSMHYGKQCAQTGMCV